MTNEALIDDEDSQFELRTEQLRMEIELASLQQPGDIILVRPGAKLVHRLYQFCFLPSFLREPDGWNMIPSHVLIVISPGLYLHAMPGTGVRHVKAEEFPLRDLSMFRVYRHKNIGNGEECFPGKIHEAAAWHYAQWYNYKLNGTLWQRQHYSHSYCSQLIASMYERTGFYKFEKPSRQALPIHLADQLKDSDDWQDVTKAYETFEEILHNGTVEKVFLNAHRMGAELIVTLPYENAEALDKFKASVDRQERMHRILAVVSTKAKRIGHRLGRKPNQQNPPLKIDIQDFLRPLIAVGLPSAERPTESKSWREENNRIIERRIEKCRQRYMSFCETALAYCVAVSILLEIQIDNPHDSPDRLMDALSFDDELIDGLKQHEFMRMDRNAVPETDRRVVYMWSVAVTAFFDLMSIRFAIANGHATWNTVLGTANLEQPLTKKWFSKGFAGKSLDDFKEQTQRLMVVLRFENVRLVNTSEQVVDDTASLETAPS
jgi:hypothetical protein